MHGWCQRQIRPLCRLCRAAAVVQIPLMPTRQGLSSSATRALSADWSYLQATQTRFLQKESLSMAGRRQASSDCSIHQQQKSSRSCFFVVTFQTRRNYHPKYRINGLLNAICGSLPTAQLPQTILPALLRNQSSTLDWSTLLLPGAWLQSLSPHPDRHRGLQCLPGR